MRIGRELAIAVCGLWMIILATLPGCVVPLEGALKDANGATIYLDDANAIVNDPQLTEDQKRQGLQDLGITDPDIIDLLLSTG